MMRWGYDGLLGESWCERGGFLLGVALLGPGAIVAWRLEFLSTMTVRGRNLLAFG